MCLSQNAWGSSSQQEKSYDSYGQESHAGTYSTFSTRFNTKKDVAFQKNAHVELKEVIIHGETHSESSYGRSASSYEDKSVVSQNIPQGNDSVLDSEMEEDVFYDFSSDSEEENDFSAIPPTPLYPEDIEPFLRKLESLEEEPEINWYNKSFYKVSVVHVLALLLMIPTLLMDNILWAYQVYGSTPTAGSWILAGLGGIADTFQFTEIVESFFQFFQGNNDYPSDTVYEVRNSPWKCWVHFVLPGFFREAFEPRFNTSLLMSVCRTLAPYFNLIASIPVAAIEPYMAYQGILHMTEEDPTHQKLHTFYLACLPFLFLRGY